MLRRLFVSVIKPPYVWLRRAVTDVAFERRYGVITAGEISLDQLGVAGEDRNKYLPAGLLSLRRILPRHEVSYQDVFIDFGSGMGRVVLQAALTYPFRRVIGVELSKQLNDIARANIERNQHRLTGKDITLVHADVLEYDIPNDITVVFCYNSFEGKTFARFIESLLKSIDLNPRDVRFIYGNPVEEELLANTGRFRKIRSLRGMRPTREWSRSNSYQLYSITQTSPTAGTTRPN